jgi:hypothetical protein
MSSPQCSSACVVSAVAGVARAHVAHAGQARAERVRPHDEAVRAVGEVLAGHVLLVPRVAGAAVRPELEHRLPRERRAARARVEGQAQRREGAGAQAVVAARREAHGHRRGAPPVAGDVEDALERARLERVALAAERLEVGDEGEAQHRVGGEQRRLGGAPDAPRLAGGDAVRVGRVDRRRRDLGVRRHGGRRVQRHGHADRGREARREARRLPAEGARRAHAISARTTNGAHSRRTASSTVAGENPFFQRTW